MGPGTVWRAGAEIAAMLTGHGHSPGALDLLHYVWGTS
jgi:hypothetical protein